jgi:hypothetical protein
MIFTKEHIKLIQQGVKTETRRIWKKPHVKVGGEYRVRSSRWFGYEADAPRIRVTAMHKEPLGSLTEDSAYREGGYKWVEFTALWRELHGEWNPEQEVTVIRFEVVK